MEDISLALYELMAVHWSLSHTSGGNLSAISYSPALGRLISRKALIYNKNSEKGYRDVKLNIDGGATSAEDQVSVLCTSISNTLCKYIFPSTIAQSSLGGRQGSNACTIIALKFGAYISQHKLEVSFAVETAAAVVDSLSN